MKCIWTPAMLLILVFPACSVSTLIDTRDSNNHFISTVMQMNFSNIYSSNIIFSEMNSLTCLLFFSVNYNFLIVYSRLQMCLWRECGCALLCCSPSTTPWRASSSHLWRCDRHTRIRTVLQHCCVRQKVSGILAHFY